MRYEAKNKYFKKISEVIGNFKNIEKPVSTRHQRAMCHKMTCCTNFLGGETAYGKGIFGIIMWSTNIIREPII